MTVDKAKAIELGAKCDECPLRDKPIVYGIGPDKAQYVVVGEAPNRDEVRHGKPFVGRSGKLLHAVLEHHGISKDEVYLTNTCLCRPDSTPPPKEAITACVNRLLTEISDREPKKVLAAGAVASKTLLGSKDGINHLRTGGPKRSPYASYDVVPTFHPSAALRTPDKFPTIVGDIKKLTRIEVGWEPTKYKVIEDVERAIEFIKKQVDHSKKLVCDIETDYKNKDHSYETPQFLCIGISHRPGAAIVYSQEVSMDPTFQQALRPYLEDPRISWGYQNGKFDLQYLWSFAPEARLTEDSLLLHYATDERKGIHDLEQIGAEILGAPNWKQNAKQYSRDGSGDLTSLPKDILHQYNASDTDLTYRLIDVLTEDAKKDDVYEMYRKLLIPGSNALARVERRGIAVDTEYLEGLSSDLSEKIADREAEFIEVCREFVDFDCNPRSPQQVLKVFHAAGFTKLKSTNKDVLEAARIKHPLRESLIAYRKVDKLYKTYVLGLLRQTKNGRIHPRFELHTTETGRTSSRDPNAQNIPKGPYIRDAFVASEGMTFISADYSQIEYRLAGILAPDENLIEQFRQGRKFHHEVATSLFGPDYDEKQYVKAKGTNFSIIYLVSPEGLAHGIKVPVREAARIINDWYAAYPGVKRFQEELQQQVRDNGELVSYFGRKRRFPLLTPDNIHDAMKEACNFPLQSTASDVNLLSLVELEPKLRGIAHPVLTVHDNLVFECPEEAKDDVMLTMKEVMENTEFSAICPIEVEFETGKRWGSLTKQEL